MLNGTKDDGKVKLKKHETILPAIFVPQVKTLEESPLIKTDQIGKKKLSAFHDRKLIKVSGNSIDLDKVQTLYAPFPKKPQSLSKVNTSELQTTQVI